MLVVFLQIVYFSIFLQLILCDLDKAMKTVKYCIRINNKPLDPNFLLGTWYTIYKYVYDSTGTSDYCASSVFTTPLKTELDQYKAKYNLVNETFSFDDGAVLSSQQNGRLKGIFVGNKMAKYFFLEPKSHMRITSTYEYAVMTFKPINDDYLIYYRCDMRGHVKFLWSRKRNQTDAELETVLTRVYELADRNRERYCKERKVATTTEYF